jgi:hypothetical protein
VHAAAISIAGYCEIQYGLRPFLGELLRHWVIEVVLRKPDAFELPNVLSVNAISQA